MVQSKVIDLESYLSELPEERREVISRLREVILRNLPQGYEETIHWGVINYEIPLSRYPNTYNKQPLSYVALAAQKNYYSLYLMAAYGSPDREAWLKEEFRKARKKLNMGKSCLRFHNLDELPLDPIGQFIGSVSVEKYIEHYEAARNRPT
jgi:hypothetical protein